MHASLPARTAHVHMCSVYIPSVDVVFWSSMEDLTLDPISLICLWRDAGGLHHDIFSESVPLQHTYQLRLEKGG